MKLLVSFFLLWAVLLPDHLSAERFLACQTLVVALTVLLDVLLGHLTKGLAHLNPRRTGHVTAGSRGGGGVKVESGAESDRGSGMAPRCPEALRLDFI